jgi:hypothetical protein
MASLNELAQRIRIEGKRQVYGKDTLTLGELIIFILALVVAFKGGWLHVPEKWRLPIAFLLIFIGMLVW